VNKQYGLATTLKQELEEKQREKAKERKEGGKEWQVSSTMIVTGSWEYMLTQNDSPGSSREQ
jgi:hypothetical protein